MKALLDSLMASSSNGTSRPVSPNSSSDGGATRSKVKRVKKFFNPKRSTLSLAAPVLGDSVQASAGGPGAVTGGVSTGDVSRTSFEIAAVAPAIPTVCETAAKHPAATAVSRRFSNPWEAALASLTPADQQLLGSLDKRDALEKALDEAIGKRNICYQKQWTYTWKGEEVVLRDVASNLVTWIEKFKSIGDVIISFDPSHAALPWAGFRFFLQVAVGDEQRMGAMLTEIEKITHLVGRCAVYERWYFGTSTTSSAAFEEVIIGLYACILRYLIDARDYYSQKTAARMAFSVFDTGKSIFDEVEQRESALIKTVSVLEGECSRVRESALAGQISDTTGRLDKRIVDESEKLGELLRQFNEPLARMRADVRVIKDDLGDAEREKTLEFISSIDYATQHENAREGRAEGSGEWLLNKDEFIQWRESSASAILWLHGIPGAGKTKLTSKVIDSILGQQSSDEAFAYFYCKRDGLGPAQPNLIMSAIIRQLSHLRRGLPLREEVVEVYKACKRLSFQESSKLALSLVDGYPQTTIVIDALDECDPDKRGQFLESLRAIMGGSSSLVKIFISSRGEIDIKLNLGDIPNILIEAKDNSEDIEKFVRDTIEGSVKHRRFLLQAPKQLRDDVIKSLVDRSQEMFLWAHLQIKQVLSMSTEGDIRKWLGKLPEGLEVTYTDIYKRIISENGSGPQLAMRALMWVMCSYQPLSPDELADLVCLGSAEHDKTSGDMLLKLSHNLLTLDHLTNTVRFSHLSVREFLETRYVSRADSHTMAARSCLSYLSSPGVLTSGDLKAFSGTYPVLFWPMHVQQCLDQQSSTELSDLLIRFLKKNSHDWYKAYEDMFNCTSVLGKDLNKLLESDREDLRFGPLTAIRITAVYGFAEQLLVLWKLRSFAIEAVGGTVLTTVIRRGYTRIVKILLEKGVNANAGSAWYRDVLQTAASCGRDSIVKLLLANGADVNAKGGKYGNALQAAVYRGHHNTVELLLANGADVNAKGDEYGNALQEAAYRDWDSIVELLLVNGADVNAQGGKYGNALQAAARSKRNNIVQLQLADKATVYTGRDNVVGLLLANGANVNAQGGKYGNALQAAVRSSRRNTVEFLLANGADVNAQGGKYEYALKAAVYTTCDNIIDLLLAKGADVNVQDSEHINALHVAICWYDDAVELLVANGADVNAQGGPGGSVLQAAASCGYDSIVKLLLAKGADVNAKGGEYGNALQAAAYRGYDKTVELLLEKGADINAQGGEHGNALQAAAYCGYDKTMELLLAKGADVNAQGGGYGSALQAAAYKGHYKAVELLLANGADVNAEGGEFGSALHAAAFVGCDGIVKLLLANGADANARSECYGSPLQAAVYANDHKSLELLLANGADVNFRDDNFESVLQTAIEDDRHNLVEILLANGVDANEQGGDYGNALQTAICKYRDSIVELLLAKGADVNAQGGYYGNALQAAHGDYDLMKLLLAKGADVNAHGGEYGNALQAVVYCGYHSCVELLLAKGADVNAQGGKYGNALQAAVYSGHHNIVELLLAKGADVNAKGGEYGNALQTAICKHHDSFVELLLANGADVNARGGKYGNALHAAAYNSHDSLVELLLAKGADVNTQGGYYGNALQAAACRGHDSIVGLLLASGANVNAYGGEYGNALQAAACCGYDDIVKLLLANGANVNAHGGEYGSALQAAVYHRRDNIMWFLLANGADVNQWGGRYGNALQAAIYHRRDNIVKSLLANGADVNAQGNYGDALQAAVYHRCDNIVEFLLAKGADVSAQNKHKSSRRTTNPANKIFDSAAGY